MEGPECNNGIRNRGLKEQLHLGSKETFYEALGQTIGLEIMKCTVGSTLRIQKNECQDTVVEPATTQVKEETAHSLRARVVGAPATLGGFVRTERERINGFTS
jgi:hypothetical protein